MDSGTWGVILVVVQHLVSHPTSAFVKVKSINFIQQGLNKCLWRLSELLPTQIPRPKAGCYISDRVHSTLCLGLLRFPCWPNLGRRILPVYDPGGYLHHCLWVLHGQHL